MANYLDSSTRLLVIPCLFLAVLASAQEAEFTGKVVGVIDGDTLDVMHAQEMGLAPCVCRLGDDRWQL